MTTERVRIRIELDYSGPAAQAASELIEGLGSDLSMWKEVSHGDRVELAALTYAAGDLDRLRQGVELARQDWRDLLVAVGDA